MNYLKKLTETFGGTWRETKPGTYETEHWRVVKADKGWVGVALNEDGTPSHGHFFPTFKQLLQAK